ncbi:hypothetical protein [Saccharopolyspora gloriosae]|uniref:hypothetical protein n=1 Tax=Saccharopolyspora gloriosae TaxID=455344 RepID=UPI001FB6F227|nr:hypothetical protein [Saccharopolyspora gloriosae]
MGEYLIGHLDVDEVAFTGTMEDTGREQYERRVAVTQTGVFLGDEVLRGLAQSVRLPAGRRSRSGKR